MNNTCSIRVFYPRPKGRIVLCTGLDWNREVEATRVEQDGDLWHFDITTDRPYFYFKPCIEDDGGTLHWSVGSNYLAISTAPEAKDVYPHFFGSTSGDITHPIDVPGGTGDYAHRVRVYQPPGYDDNTLKRYPVLYMHDGTNLFFPEESFLGQTWEVDETMDMLDAMNVIDKVIVVGVYAGDRMSEYTKPGYEAYGRFVVESLKPFIDGAFRTLRGPEHTAVMGSSLGGVVSFHLAWQWPEVFGMAACLSSTFGYRDDFFDRVRSEPRRDVRFYLDSGWPEDNYEPTQGMRDLLASRGYKSGEDLLYYAFPGAEHNESLWAARSHIPFQFFFGKTPVFE